MVNVPLLFPVTGQKPATVAVALPLHSSTIRAAIAAHLGLADGIDLSLVVQGALLEDGKVDAVASGASIKVVPRMVAGRHANEAEAFAAMLRHFQLDPVVMKQLKAAGVSNFSELKKVMSMPREMSINVDPTTTNPQQLQQMIVAMEQTGAKISICVGGEQLAMSPSELEAYLAKHAPPAFQRQGRVPGHRQQHAPPASSSTTTTGTASDADGFDMPPPDCVPVQLPLGMPMLPHGMPVPFTASMPPQPHPMSATEQFQALARRKPTSPEGRQQLQMAHQAMQEEVKQGAQRRSENRSTIRKLEELREKKRKAKLRRERKRKAKFSGAELTTPAPTSSLAPTAAKSGTKATPAKVAKTTAAPKGKAFAGLKKGFLFG